MLIDKHGRRVDYVRLSVTDRCNLRCLYCMPEEGIEFSNTKDLLSFAEMEELLEVLASQGVTKIRITGGEPFVRKGLMDFLKTISSWNIFEISMTTNAILIGNHIDDLKKIGIRTVNISLDALDRERFFQITRRDKYDLVYENIMKLLANDFKVKVNCVVMEDQNIDDIIPFVQWTGKYPLAVRFLEEMPFNGGNERPVLNWNYIKIKEYIDSHFPEIKKLTDPQNSTSINYQVKDFKGTFGIIPAFSRTFCGTCNRLRISAQGEIRTCLYGKSDLNLRNILRKEGIDAIKPAIMAAVSSKPKNGFEAEAQNLQGKRKAMTTLGG